MIQIMNPITNNDKLKNVENTIVDANTLFCYDMRHDRIGDRIASAFLLKQMKRRNPLLQLAYFDGKCLQGSEKEVRWSKDFRIFDWMDMRSIRSYCNIESVMERALLTPVRIFRSICPNQTFYIWDEMKREEEQGFYPVMTMLDKYEEWFRKWKIKFKIPNGIRLVTCHMLNNVKSRDEEYVRRRSSNLENFVGAISYILKCFTDVIVVRLGSRYDAIKGLYLGNHFIDMTKYDLNLNESLAIINHSSMFFGGDTGMKLAASSMSVPVVIEIDKESFEIGGLAGIPLSNLKYNIFLSSKKRNNKIFIDNCVDTLFYDCRHVLCSKCLREECVCDDQKNKIVEIELKRC